MTTQTDNSAKFRTQLRGIFGPLGFEIWKKYYMETPDFWNFCDCGCDQVCKTGSELKEPRRQMLQQIAHEFYPGQNVTVNSDATRLIFNSIEHVSSEQAMVEARELKEAIALQQQAFQNQERTFYSEIENLKLENQSRTQQVQALERMLQQPPQSTEVRIKEVQLPKAEKASPVAKPVSPEPQKVKSPAPVPVPVKTPSQPTDNKFRNLLASLLFVGAVAFPAANFVAEKVDSTLEQMAIERVSAQIAELTSEVSQIKAEAEAKIAACQASYGSSIEDIEAIADQINSLKTQQSNLRK